MIRVLMFLAVVTVVALGATWLADHPGTVLITWGGRDYQFTTLTGVVSVLAFAVLVMLAWSIIRFVFHIPSILSVAGRTKRRNRGLKALSRGMVAVGAGDATSARRHAKDADRYLPQDPMALLLKAQAAQLSGDRDEAQAIFRQMLDHEETRTLGLRGLHMEAQRRGDEDAAFRFASEAQTIATLPWAGQAVLQYRAARRDWAAALAAVERNAGARLVDRPTANRQRAVLLTAMALDSEEKAADEALALARDALRVAPTLVPAAALAGRLLARKGDLRKAAKLVEAAFVATPHPDLARAYINARLGDSAADRLARAEMLARQAPGQPESRLIVGRAALEARDFRKARQVMGPLINGEEGSRPTARTCLLMADLEEAEFGETGALFEWLQRAARAPHDPAWIADGVISDTWGPVSPVTGRLDAFVWETPKEQLTVTEHQRVLPARTMPEPEPERGVAHLTAPAAASQEALPALSVEQTDRERTDRKEPETEQPTLATPVRSSVPVVFPLAAAPDDPGSGSARSKRPGPARAESGDALFNALGRRRKRV